MLLLSSGLFLGWSLGANHGGNLFGPAVGARMLPFAAAALMCSILVVVGAVVGGAGATATLGALGSVSAPGGAFVIALATAATVTFMSKLGLPVSTSQAIVGAIIGWNAFAGARTGVESLTAIVASWVAAPLIAAAVAAGAYVATRAALARSGFHLLTIDALTRTGLVAVSAFGAYSLGANNIANVMGVFVPAAPFHAVVLFGLRLTPAHQLFALGGIAIGAGIMTYSRRVVHTVGSDLLKLSPLAALVVLFAHALVLFVFSSREVGGALTRLGLPRIPLVPVSSSQAITGAILGIALVKRARGLRIGVLRGIAVGWVSAPPLAALVCYVALFFAQNVFELEVSAEGGRAATGMPSRIDRPPAAAFRLTGHMNATSRREPDPGPTRGSRNPRTESMRATRVSLPAPRAPLPRSERSSEACPSGSPILPNAGACAPCTAPAAIPFVSRRTAVSTVMSEVFGTGHAPARLLAFVPAVRAAESSS